MGNPNISVSSGFLDRTFRLRENKTNVKQEVVGGVTSFLAVAYILAVNPSILGATGMSQTAVLLATAISSAIATILMAIFANYPFVLSAGMGLNAYFAFTVVLGQGYSWQVGLFCVFLEGVIFIILSLTHVREAIFNAIPQQLKYAISAGIGAFILFIALQNAGIVQGNGSTLVGIINFRNDFNTAGICALLALIGFMITVLMYYEQVPGSILLGILATWVLGMICQAVGIYQPNPEAGFYSVYPTFAPTDFSALGETFGQCFKADFSGVNIMDIVVITLTLLYTDVFDTIGTLIGGATKGGMLDKDGKLPRIKGALAADAIGTSVGAVFGTTTITTFVESSAGIAAGAKTGLASIVTAILFLIATFGASIFTSIPSFATAPALMLVGFLMFTVCGKLAFHEDNDMLGKVSAFLCIFMMVLFYSIADGIAVGIISYVVLNTIGNIIDKIRKKETNDVNKVGPLLYVLAAVLLLKYALL